MRPLEYGSSDTTWRALARPALALAVGAVLFGATGCASHPDSIFTAHTDFNRDVGTLFKLLIFFGALVFVIVEGILIVALVRFRRRGAGKRPVQTYGSTTLELVWTVVPILILCVIAVPTVRTTFRTQAKPLPSALQVEAIGHQWWWEFRYPQYTATNASGGQDTLVTANEVYMPLGRQVNFTLKAQDVAHSFWVPSLGGKRDLIPLHTNHLTFTPDSATETVFNGFCAEYCGMSHANMQFRAYTVSPEKFARWTAQQLATSAFAIPPTGAAPDAGASSKISFASDQVPSYAIPRTQLPTTVGFDWSLRGDPARGGMALMSGQGACLGCHAIRGNPSMVGTSGPNLTHIASRATIAGGMFPNDARHLALWIKNAREMKPGSFMPTLGAGQFDPIQKKVSPEGLTDQQIADIVAYLQALK